MRFKWTVPVEGMEEMVYCYKLLVGKQREITKRKLLRKRDGNVMNKQQIIGCTLNSSTS